MLWSGKSRRSFSQSCTGFHNMLHYAFSVDADLYTCCDAVARQRQGKGSMTWSQSYPPFLVVVSHVRDGYPHL